MHNLIKKSNRRDIRIVDVINYPANLVCVLFGTAIPTSFFKLFVICTYICVSQGLYTERPSIFATVHPPDTWITNYELSMEALHIRVA